MFTFEVQNNKCMSLRNFIEVTAEACNQDGHTLPSGQSLKVEFRLNTDMVAAFHGNEVALKTGKVIILNGKFYTNLRAKSVKFED